MKPSESQGQSLLQVFDNIIGGRAYLSVLYGQVCDLMKSFSVCVRIFPACLWPGLIDKTGIVVSEKRTGHLFQHHEVIFVTSQILFDELVLFPSQKLRDPADVLVCKDRARRLAAIGAIQAIGPAEFFLVKLMDQKIESLSRLFLQAAEVPLALLPFFVGQVRQLPEYFFHLRIH